MTATSSDDAIVEASDGAAELLLYDYFKHLTTLALVALGGTLGIAEGKLGRDVLALIVICIGLGGGLALVGLLTVVRERVAGRPLPRSARWLRTGSGALFSFGVGVFLAVFLRTL
jgi:hypothetical protein